MKNKLTDLNNHLFAQLERLGEENLEPEKIEQEIKRTDAIVKVSEQVINNAQLALDAAKMIAANGGEKWEQIMPTFQQIPDYKAEKVK